MKKRGLDVCDVCGGLRAGHHKDHGWQGPGEAWVRGRRELGERLYLLEVQGIQGARSEAAMRAAAQKALAAAEIFLEEAEG